MLHLTGSFSGRNSNASSSKAFLNHHKPMVECLSVPSSFWYVTLWHIAPFISFTYRLFTGSTCLSVSLYWSMSSVSVGTLFLMFTRVSPVFGTVPWLICITAIQKWSGAPGWLSQLSVWLLVLTQNMISHFVSSSPTLGPRLSAWILSLSLSLSLSVPPQHVYSCARSFAQNKKENI